MSDSFLAACAQRALDCKPAPTAPPPPLEQILALAMAQHPRLGADSPAKNLQADCLRRIFEVLTPFIVLDLGSRWSRAGFSGLLDPRWSGPCLVLPSVVGTPRVPGLGSVACVGEEALRKRGVLQLKYPIEYGVVTNWDDAELLWRHAFHRLGVAATMRPVLLTEPPLNPKASREKVTQLMFDCFDVPKLVLAIAPVLALYNSGRTTGLVIQSGDNVTWCVPVYEGYAMPHACVRHDFAGQDVTHYLEKCLIRRGYSLTTPAEREAVREIKEKLAFVADDYERSLSLDPTTYETSFTMADGRVICLGHERYQCAEVLFQPHLIGMSAVGLADNAYSAIMKCDADLPSCKELYQNIVLSGGTCMLRGLAERLRAELSARAPERMPINVIAPTAGESDGASAAWCGGAILASLDSFEPMWVTRAMYDKEGPAVVHRHCF